MHYTDERLCVGLWHNILLADIAGDTGLVGMRAIGDGYKLLARTHARVGGLCVVRPDAPLSTIESRKEAQRFAQELGPTLAHVAVVLEADGVVAQLFKSMVRAFNVFTNTPLVSVDQSIEGGIKNLASVAQSPLRQPQTSKELHAAFTQLRDRFTPKG